MGSSRFELCPPLSHDKVSEIPTGNVGSFANQLPTSVDVSGAARSCAGEGRPSVWRSWRNCSVIDVGSDVGRETCKPATK